MNPDANSLKGLTKAQLTEEYLVLMAEYDQLRAGLLLTLELLEQHKVDVQKLREKFLD